MFAIKVIILKCLYFRFTSHFISDSMGESWFSECWPNGFSIIGFDFNFIIRMLNFNHIYFTPSISSLHQNDPPQSPHFAKMTPSISSPSKITPSIYSLVQNDPPQFNLLTFQYEPYFLILFGLIKSYMSDIVQGWTILSRNWKRRRSTKPMVVL